MNHLAALPIPHGLKVEQTIKEGIKEKEQYNIPFVYDGEPGLDDFLANIAESGTVYMAWSARALSRPLKKME